VTGRRFAVIAAPLGVFLGASPFFGWYRLDLPGRALRVSGIEGAGELWALPVLGTVIVGTAVAIVVGRLDPKDRASSWTVWSVALCGVFALGWIVRSIFDIRAVGFAAIADPPAVPLRPEPVAFVAAAVASAMTALALWWLRQRIDDNP
jgi:ABC-type Mn2+/Zn2+ transport system permease subunit